MATTGRRARAVAHFFVLGFGNIYEHLRGGVVDVDAPQYGGAVVRDLDLALLARDTL